MENYYDRYKPMRDNGYIDGYMPFIAIPTNDTDRYVTFNSFTMRMDTISYKYYGDPNYGWLILNANPDVSSYEYQIPDGTVLRIPYPLETAISRYENGIKLWKATHQTTN